MLRIGVAQTSNSIDLDANAASIDGFLRRFEGTGVNLLLFPECALSGFSARIGDCTLGRLEPFLSRVEDWSRIHGVSVVLPTALAEDRKIYNAGFFFEDGRRRRFHKRGLTESETRFFALPDEGEDKVFEIRGYRCGLLICREAQQDTDAHLRAESVDLILWPGYWGWTLGEEWGDLDSVDQPNSVHANVARWRRPLIQANFAFNALGDARAGGPEGLSVVVGSDNQLAYRAAHRQECGFIVTLDRVCSGSVEIQDCRPL
jgi:predicted amidohydrolase